jgi:hypothetical protein
MHQQKINKHFLVNGYVDLVRRKGYAWGDDHIINIQWGLKTIYYW